jgi:hypothetical protein
MCNVAHQGGGGTGRVIPSRFRLQGEEIRALTAGEPYEHLGTPTGFRVKQTTTETLDDLAEDICAVDRSLLAPWQKFDAVATFILPRMDFCLKGSRVEKGPLAKLDRALRRTAKRWMSLSHRASAELVFLPPRVYPCAQQYPIIQGTCGLKKVGASFNQ